jgi:hypothetical protein
MRLRPKPEALIGACVRASRSQATTLWQSAEGRRVISLEHACGFELVEGKGA